MDGWMMRSMIMMGISLFLFCFTLFFSLLFWQHARDEKQGMDGWMERLADHPDRITWVGGGNQARAGCAEVLE
jgi:hypothetical protein